MAVIRTAIITYEHEDLTWAEDGLTIGQQIDANLAKSIGEGKTIQEVTVLLDPLGPEMGHLREMYEGGKRRR